MNQGDVRRRIENAWASQQCENVHARHQYLHSGGRSREEFSTIWSKSGDASWGYNFGRMLGFGEVWYGNVTEYDSSSYEQYCNMYRRYPVIGGRDPRPLSLFSYHPLSSGVIEVAADGRSARAVWLTPGVMFRCLNEKGGRWFAYVAERYATDFVRENGEWLYLHEQCASDMMTAMDDKNWAADSFAKGNEVFAVGFTDRPSGGRDDFDTEGPPRADEKPLHYYYSATQVVQDTCPWPEPYEKLDNDHSYTPLHAQYA